MVNHLSHQFFHLLHEVWPIHSKEIEPRRHALEQLQFFSGEKIILLSDLFPRIVPFCRSVQLTGFTGLGPTHIVGSRSRHTLSIGQVPEPSRRRKHAAGLARTRFTTVTTSVFCPRHSLSVTATTPGQSHNFSQLVCTSQQTQCMPSPLLSATMKKKKTSPCTRM